MHDHPPAWWHVKYEIGGYRSNPTSRPRLPDNINGQPTIGSRRDICDDDPGARHASYQLVSTFNGMLGIRRTLDHTPNVGDR